MGIVFRQSVKSVLVLFAGAALGAGIQYAGPYVLSKPDMSLQTTFIYLAALLQIFVQLGSANSANVYAVRYASDPAKKSAVVTACLLTPLIVTLLAAVPAWIWREPFIALYGKADQARLRIFYPWLIGFTGLWALSVTLEQYLQSQMKIALVSFIREILIRLINIALLALYFFRIIDFPQLITGTVITYLFPVAMLLLQTYRTGIRLTLPGAALSAGERKDVLRFAWFHFLMGAAFTLIGYLDLIMLGMLDPNGMAPVAVYSRAVFVVTLAVMPNRVLSTAASTAINKEFVRNNMDGLKDLYNRSALNMLIVGVTMILVVVPNLPNLVQVLPAGYEGIIPVTLILLLGRLTDLATGLNTELLTISNYYRFNSLMSLVIVGLMIAGNMLLIPRMGMYGAAWVSTGALVVFNLAKLWYIRAKMGIQPFSRRSLNVLLAGLLVGTAGYFFPHYGHPLLDTLVRTAVVMLLFVGFLLWYRPSADMTQYLEQIRKSRRLF